MAALGFLALGLAWIVVTGMGLARALQRRWMLRSFALTAAAITLRVYLGASMAAGIDDAALLPPHCLAVLGAQPAGGAMVSALQALRRSFPERSLTAAAYFAGLTRRDASGDWALAQSPRRVCFCTTTMDGLPWVRLFTSEV